MTQESCHCATCHPVKWWQPVEFYYGQFPWQRLYRPGNILMKTTRGENWVGRVGKWIPPFLIADSEMIRHLIYLFVY